MQVPTSVTFRGRLAEQWATSVNAGENRAGGGLTVPDGLAPGSGSDQGKLYDCTDWEQVEKRIALALVGLGTALVVAAGIVVPHVLPQRTAEHGDRYAVTAGTDVCGTGWPTSDTNVVTAPQHRPVVHGGTQVFRIHNTSIAGVEVELEDPTSGAVFLDAEGLGAGASQDYRVRLTDGAYRFRCLPADADTITGPTVRVTGAAHLADATPGVVPVTRNDLIPPSQAYGHWIESRLPTLQADVVALAADVHAGDRATAERDWLTAHREYEQLGAAYGAFGDEDTAIDGVPASGRTALDDPDLTGFHRVEALLWAGRPTTDAEAPADALVTAVQHLRTTFPTARIDPLDIGLRAHEILENALQFEATGKTDAGSHTNLATIDANVSGTEHALAPIHDVLRTRYPALAETERSLVTLQQTVEGFDHGGTWTALDDLTPAERRVLDARLDASLELLAPVAAICDIRRTT